MLIFSITICVIVIVVGCCYAFQKTSDKNQKSQLPRDVFLVNRSDSLDKKEIYTIPDSWIGIEDN